MYTYNAKVVDIYDGDTITLDVDLGFNIKFKEKYRLAFIDAPELRGEERESGLITKQWLVDLILNKDIIVKTHKDKKDKYGRYIAEIFTTTDTISINQIMLNEGLAKPYIE